MRSDKVDAAGQADPGEPGARGEGLGIDHGHPGGEIDRSKPRAPAEGVPA